MPAHGSFGAQGPGDDPVPSGLPLSLGFAHVGIRKMWYAMNREGFHIGRDKTARLMKLAGVSGRRRGRTPVTTISPKAPDHRVPHFADAVDREILRMHTLYLWDEQAIA